MAVACGPSQACSCLQQRVHSSRPRSARSRLTACVCGSSSAGTSSSGRSPGIAARPGQRGAQLVHVGQHLRHGGEQRRRDLAVDLGVRVQRTRQHRRLQHRHLGVLGEVADAQRHQVGALGDHARRAHRARRRTSAPPRSGSGSSPPGRPCGTAASMRRLAISRMRALTLALTSALPSTSLCSCFTSWWLIFRRVGVQVALQRHVDQREERPAPAAAAAGRPAACCRRARCAAGSGSASTPPKLVEVARR